MALSPDLDENIPVTRRGDPNGFQVLNINLDDGQETTYASAFFAANPNRAPPVRIPLSPPGETIELMIGAILGVGQNALDIGIALRYIWLCFERIKVRLEQNWVSHGVNIGVAGAEVTPRNLLFHVAGDPGVEYVVANPGTPGQWVRALLMVLSPIRLNPQLRRDYLDTLTTRYKSVIEEFAGTRVSEAPGTFALQHTAWVQNVNFLRLASALDMFLYNYREHEFAKLRYATVTTRFRDCAGVGDLRYILEAQSLTMMEFSQWVWTASIADDLERVLKPGEEIDKKDSYTPYIASMRLCVKSPYSATANPNLHIFVHAVGCAGMRTRSINARMVGDVNLTDTVANAAVLAYARGSRYDLQPEYYRHGSVMAPKPRRATTEEGSVAGTLDFDLLSDGGLVEGMQKAAEPDGAAPHLWWQFIVSNKSMVPAYIMEPMYAAWNKIGVVRAGTIGEHLKALGGLRLANPL